MCGGGGAAALVSIEPYLCIRHVRAKMANPYWPRVRKVEVFDVLCTQLGFPRAAAEMGSEDAPSDERGNNKHSFRTGPVEASGA